MAIKLNKPGSSASGSVSAPSSKQHKEEKAAASGGGLGFLKKGKAAQETFAKEEHKAEMAAKSKVNRFFVPQDKEASVTFLDGNLADGVLDISFYYEHNVNMNGKWNNFFICTQDDEPCPICEGGSSASYVGVMTVIDHSEYVSKKDGKTYKDQIRLFVAKRDTIKMLQKIATKRGGLRGCRFDVSRTGDKSPSVGSMFDFSEKYSEEALQKAFGAEKTQPLNYAEILAGMYLPATELRKMGFGSAQGPIGGEAPAGGDFDDDM